MCSRPLLAGSGQDCSDACRQARLDRKLVTNRAGAHPRPDRDDDSRPAFAWVVAGKAVRTFRATSEADLARAATLALPGPGDAWEEAALWLEWPTQWCLLLSRAWTAELLELLLAGLWDTVLRAIENSPWPRHTAALPVRTKS